MSRGLLIVDVQNDYFAGGKMELAGSEDAAMKIKQVIERIRAKHGEVIYIQHIATKPTATFFIAGTEGVHIYDAIRPQKGDTVIPKHYPNSFRETTLDAYCRERGLDSFVIVGMMTHMCIDTTARAAYDLGYKCILLGDCCATRDLILRDKVVRAEDVQNAFLAAIDGTFAKVMDSEEYLKEVI